MSEISEISQSPEILTPEQEAQIPELLGLALEKFHKAYLSRRNKFQFAKLAAILNPNFGGMDEGGNKRLSDNVHFIVDGKNEYVVERIEPGEGLVGGMFLEIAITKFPFEVIENPIHERNEYRKRSEISEGLRMRIIRPGFGSGHSFVEYHRNVRNAAGEPIPSRPIKKPEEAIKRGKTFLSGI